MSARYPKGYVHISPRQTDLVISGGFQRIVRKEIERRIDAHAGVIESARDRRGRMRFSANAHGGGWSANKGADVTEAGV